MIFKDWARSSGIAFDPLYSERLEALWNRLLDELDYDTSAVVTVMNEVGATYISDRNRIGVGVKPEDAKQRVYCSFCGLHESETSSMSRGPLAQICGNCVVRIVEEAVNPKFTFNKAVTARGKE